MARRRSAAPAVGRTHLLGEVWRERVRWTVPNGPAMWHPRSGDQRRPVDVTTQLGELLQARPQLVWLEPWDIHNQPAWTRVLLTGKGEDVLLDAQVKPRRRRPRKAAPASVRPRSAVRRRTYRPKWLVALRRYRPAQVKRRLRKTVRARRDRAVAAVLAWMARWWITQKATQVKAGVQIWWDGLPAVQHARKARTKARRWRPAAVRRRARRRVRRWLRPQVRGHWRRGGR